MSSKTNENTQSEDREQFLYAQDRIRQKKRLNQHFVFFLVGSVFIIILSQVLKVDHFLLRNWHWLIVIWAFLFVIHAFNVFITNRFMGKKWENKQLDKLREKQRQRLIELQKKVDSEANVNNPIESETE